MAPALCLTPPSYPRITSPASGIVIESHTNPKDIRVNSVSQGPSNAKYCFLIAKASPKGSQNTKPNSVICADCDGNGAVLCSQCKGSGVNSVDVFNGQFKAGDSCWLCGGRKEMLCGNCNGAGFIGGFLSTYDQKQLAMNLERGIPLVANRDGGYIPTDTVNREVDMHTLVIILSSKQHKVACIPTFQIISSSFSSTQSFI